MFKAVVKPVVWHGHLSISVMDSTKEFVTQSTSVKVVWRRFLVVTKNLVSLAGSVICSFGCLFLSSLS